jgi:hypothetical protein
MTGHHRLIHMNASICSSVRPGYIFFIRARNSSAVSNGTNIVEFSGFFVDLLLWGISVLFHRCTPQASPSSG